jgi:hypothetical protein
VTLTFRHTFASTVIRDDCVEQPRVYRLMQRSNEDADWIVSYHVEGIPAQVYHSAEDAVEAARSNPG